MRRIRACTGALLAGAVLMGTACGDNSTSNTEGDRASFQPTVAKELVEEASARQTFVGVVTGTNAYIALDVTPGRPVRAYVCDSNQIKQWFDGALSENILQATLGGGTGTLRATRAGDAFSGTVDIAGRLHPFRAERARHPAGLYLGAAHANTDVRGTWIVLSDGSQRGSATKGSVAVESTVSPESGEANVGGSTIDVGSGGGSGTTPIALKKTAKTKSQRCADFQKSYNDQIKLRDGHPEGSDNWKFHDGLARSILQDSVNAGCFDF